MNTEPENRSEERPKLRPNRVIAEGGFSLSKKQKVWIVIYLLNLSDWILTSLHMSYGATEANPLMNYLMQQHIYAFAAFKIFVVGALCYLICEKSNDKSKIKPSDYLVLIPYILVNVWHIFGLSMYFLG